MRKFRIILAAAMLLVLLTGCCMSHQWQEATCTAPKTCAKCAETEGDALGHNWQEATCAAPKTCASCGETEGAALSHNWQEATCTAPKTCTNCAETEGDVFHDSTEATYQEPAVCKVCGKTTADPLTPGFEAFDVKGQWIEAGKKYDYATVCDLDETKETKGTLTIAYDSQTSGNDLEEKDGYEWKSVKATLSFSDKNAQKYGFRASSAFRDYYYEDGSPVDAGPTGEFVPMVPIVWNGKEYMDCVYKYNISFQRALIIEYFVRVPSGYDGMVWSFYHPQNYNEVSFPDCTDENTLLFRLS